MPLTRRAFLRAAVLAPMAAVAAPLFGEAPSREYVRAQAASFDEHLMQITFTVNMPMQMPRTCAVLTGIGA